MPLALSICVVFTSLMESANGAQFLNTTSLFPSFGLSLVCWTIDKYP